MRRWLCGQGPVWVSQQCRATTCLDLTAKPLRPPQSMSPTIALPVLLWELRILSASMSAAAMLQCCAMRSKTNRHFHILLAPSVSALAATQYPSDIIQLLSCQPWLKMYFKYEAETWVILEVFLCLYLFAIHTGNVSHSKSYLQMMHGSISKWVHRDVGR